MAWSSFLLLLVPSYRPPWWPRRVVIPLMRTKTLLGILMLTVVVSTGMAQDGFIANGVVWRDTAGEEIWCNGGHMIRQGDTFYWVGYDTAPDRWPWKINLYSSQNLVDWKFENTVIEREGEFGDVNWAGRPGLLSHAATKKYVILFECSTPRWERHRIGFAACDRIDGKYELVNVQAAEEGRSTGDQSVYQEGDKAYLVVTMDSDVAGRKYLNTSLAIFELSPDFQRIERKVFEGFENVSGDKKVVPRDQSSREASHIIKVADTYYWFTSALVGWNSSATTWATAHDLAGPWTELRPVRTDPPSNDSYNTQHDFVVPIVGSQTTSYLYAGDRYSQYTEVGTGRNIFLPLAIEDGVPVLRWHDRWRIDLASGRIITN